MLLEGIQVHTVSMHQAVLKIQGPECCVKTPQALFKFCSQPIRGESGGGWSLMERHTPMGAQSLLCLPYRQVMWIFSEDGGEKPFNH